MKSLMIAVAISFCFLSSFGQEKMDDIQKIIDQRDAYLLRSQNQKLGAFITLGCGTAALVPSLIMMSNGGTGEFGDIEKGLQAAGLFLVGVGCIGASAIQFINSNRNLKRANRLSLQINKPVAIYMGLNNRVLPYSVGVGIPIN